MDYNELDYNWLVLDCNRQMSRVTFVVIWCYMNKKELNSNEFQVSQSFCPYVCDSWGPLNCSTCEIVSLGFIKALFVGPICHCIGEVPDAIIKEMFLWIGLWQMNVSLQRQRNRGRSSLLTHDIHHSDGSGSLSHVSSFYVQSHWNTDNHHTYGYTQIHSISLKCLGSWSFSGCSDWCWGATVIRETGEGKIPVLSGYLSGLWTAQTLENGFGEHGMVCQMSITRGIYINSKDQFLQNLPFRGLTCVVEEYKVKKTWLCTQPVL